MSLSSDDRKALVDYRIENYTPPRSSSEAAGRLVLVKNVISIGVTKTWCTFSLAILSCLIIV